MKRTHAHTALLICALAVTAFVLAAYIYMYYAVQASASRAALARDIVSVEQTDKSHEQELVQLYQSTASDRARLSGFFIPADSVVTFIEAIEALGPQSGSTVSISSISSDPLDGSASGTTGEAHAHVDAQGSWSSVMRTLMLAEVLPYKTTLDHVHLDVSLSGDGKAAKRAWSLSFDMSAAIIAATSTSSQ